MFLMALGLLKYRPFGIKMQVHIYNFFQIKIKIYASNMSEID